MVAPIAARAQESTKANPVTAAAQEIFERFSKYMVEAAKQMPADKYSYQPSKEQWTVGKIVSHVAQANDAVCKIISDTPAPDASKLTQTDPKDTLVSALEASNTYCSQVLANLQDSKLGDTVTFFRGRKTTRARALFELTDDQIDHYAQLASYLRANGMLPPSAQPQK